MQHIVGVDNLARQVVDLVLGCQAILDPLPDHMDELIQVGLAAATDQRGHDAIIAADEVLRRLGVELRPCLVADRDNQLPVECPQGQLEPGRPRKPPRSCREYAAVLADAGPQSVADSVSLMHSAS